MDFAVKLRVRDTPGQVDPSRRGVVGGSGDRAAVAIVVADFIIRYPEDTNVPVPQAFLFYPAVGFVAEIVFHVLPLALLLLALTPLAKGLDKDRVVWLGILVVAVLELTFQVLFEEKPYTWGALYTWIHRTAPRVLPAYGR